MLYVQQCGRAALKAEATEKSNQNKRLYSELC